MIYLGNCTKTNSSQVVSGRTWKPSVTLTNNTDLPLINARPSFVYLNKGGERIVYEPHLPKGSGNAYGTGASMGVKYGYMATECYFKSNSSGSITEKGRNSLVILNADVYANYPDMARKFSSGESLDGCVALSYIDLLPSSFDGFTTYGYEYHTEIFKLSRTDNPKTLPVAYTYGFPSIINQVAFVYCRKCKPVGIQSTNIFDVSKTSSFTRFNYDNTTGLEIGYGVKSGKHLDGGIIKICSVPVNSKQYDVYALWDSVSLSGEKSVIDSLNVVTNPIVWFKSTSTTSDASMEAFISYEALETISDKQS